MYLIALLLCLCNLFFTECFGGGEIIEIKKAVAMNPDASLLRNRYNQERCPVCFDNEKDIPESERVYLPCEHMVCKPCYQLLKERPILKENQMLLCPFCNKPYARVIYHDASDERAVHNCCTNCLSLMFLENTCLENTCDVTAHGLIYTGYSALLVNSVFGAYACSQGRFADGFVACSPLLMITGAIGVVRATRKAGQH